MSGSVRKVIAFMALAISMLSLYPILLPAWHPCCLGSIGIVQNRIENLPLLTAYRRNFFDPKRLQVKLIPLATNAQLLKMVAAKDIDFAYAVSLPLTLEDIIKTREFRVVGSVTNSPAYYVVGQKELKKPSDLTGRSLGVLATDYSANYLARTALNQLGINENKISFVPFSNQAELQTALVNRRVDAIVAYSVSALRLEKAGFAPVLSLREYVKTLATFGIVTSGEWLKLHPSDPRAVELLAGLIQAHTWLFDPKNKPAVQELMKQKVDGIEVDDRLYDELVGPRGYLARTPRISNAALDEVLKARPSLPSMEKIPDYAIDPNLFDAAAKRVAR